MPIEIAAFSEGLPVRAADHRAVATEVLRLGNLSVISQPGAPQLSVRNTPGGAIISIARARDSQFIGRKSGTGPNAEAAYSGSDPRAWVRELYIADESGDTDDGIDWQLAPATGSGDGRWITASRLADDDVVVLQGWDQQDPAVLRYFYQAGNAGGGAIIKITDATPSALLGVPLTGFDGGGLPEWGGTNVNVVDRGDGTPAVDDEFPAAVIDGIYVIDSNIPIGEGGERLSVSTVTITGTSPLAGNVAAPISGSRNVTDLGDGTPAISDQFPCLAGGSICVIVSHATGSTNAGLVKIVTGDGPTYEGDKLADDGTWDTNGGAHYSVEDVGPGGLQINDVTAFKLGTGSTHYVGSVAGPTLGPDPKFIKIVSDTGALTGDLFISLTGSSPNWDTNGGGHYNVIDIGAGCPKAGIAYPAVHSGSYYVISTAYFLLKDDE